MNFILSIKDISNDLYIDILAFLSKNTCVNNFCIIYTINL